MVNVIAWASCAMAMLWQKKSVTKLEELEGGGDRRKGLYTRYRRTSGHEHEQALRRCS